MAIKDIQKQELKKYFLNCISFNQNSQLYKGLQKSLITKRIAFCQLIKSSRR